MKIDKAMKVIYKAYGYNDDTTKVVLAVERAVTREIEKNYISKEEVKEMVEIFFNELNVRLTSPSDYEYIENLKQEQLNKLK